MNKGGIAALTDRALLHKERSRPDGGHNVVSAADRSLPTHTHRRAESGSLPVAW